NSVDYVYRLPGYPEVDGPNAKMRISSHTLCCGGQVATALATCAAMGLRTKYVGATGTDDNGRRIRDELARLRNDTSDAVIRCDQGRACDGGALGTTGAGDVFRGACVASVLRQDRVTGMLRFATAAAGVRCTRLGALTGVPAGDEAEALMQRAVAKPATA